MTSLEELMFHDALLEGLTATESFAVERQMTSGLLAICHAQGVELAALRRQLALARADLQRFTAAVVLDV